MGGGRAILTPTTVVDPETGTNGRRLDGKDLINQWLAEHTNGAYVTTRDDLLNLDVATTDSILGTYNTLKLIGFYNSRDFHNLGLFSPSHMEFFLESETANNPTLEEMTRKAIEMLQKETNGYVLLVEGVSVRE